MAWVESGVYELTNVVKDQRIGHKSYTRIDNGNVACYNADQNCILILKTNTTIGDNNKIDKYIVLSCKKKSNTLDAHGALNGNVNW